ncbi:putative zinc metalloproteinase [Colletotrichum trifolii]|uniref:Putative zinc metalloproteinase n=1 Tax=Colletotrichum trifolii TaxID=5466 RepID=A0A4R8QX04_COLTR|nr:putative zinc metalloproteinase [Colletotrichum trifolii]
MSPYMPSPKRQRIVPSSSLVIDNFEEGETVHQRCIIIKGRFPAETLDNTSADKGHVTVETTDGTNTVFPTQHWPITNNRFKIIALLSPGRNHLSIQRVVGAHIQQFRHEINLNYIPLLQSPPLHLAIMVAKDSPLLIDCPPGKHGPISSAHSSLDAAIAKLRMSAYMWQALTAEDMRMKGLGRRSFRLEEEWAADTTSREFLAGLHDSALHSSGAMRSTAKVHVIRTKKTVADLRKADVAQQNESGQQREKLFDYFRAALAAHGAPFETSGRPIVAGMILDSHYSADQNLILAHAALGCHEPSGLSLGMMGSHLAYSWPRFLEEVTACLLDTRNPGPTVGNDNKECASFWEACAVGQGAFLHEVGHAFGAPHTSGIMARGYSRHWPKNFLSQTAFSAHTKQEGCAVDDATENDARWDLKDALSFRLLPHFWLPGDVKLPPQARTSAPAVELANIEAEYFGFTISCAAQIARIEFNGIPEPQPTIAQPGDDIFYSLKSLDARFPRTEDLKLTVLGMNGKARTVQNVWKYLASPSYIRVPDSDVILRKRSVVAPLLEESDDQDTKFWQWATLLSRKNNGRIVHAEELDVRTGCILHGVYVYFSDGERVNCGPRVDRWDHSRKHTFGGHAAEMFSIPKGKSITKIEIAREQTILAGMRVHFEDGSAGGALCGYGDEPEEEVLTLDVQPNEMVVGFYGRNYWGEHFDGVVEFGIITAPKDVELPDSVYDLKELENTDGGQELNTNGDEQCEDRNDDEMDDDE